jgi:cardiolipin synthase
MIESQVLPALWTVAFLLVHLAVIARVILRPHREPASRVAWIVVMIVRPIYLSFERLRVGVTGFAA